MSVTRRTVLTAAACGVGAAGVASLLRWDARASACGHAMPAQAFDLGALAPPPKLAADFVRWLRVKGVAKDHAVQNLVFNFYDTDKDKGTWVYPMLSGKAILWFVKRGLVDDAKAVQRTLLAWQERDKARSKSYGAFPSELLLGKTGWAAGERCYSGDNLVILEALCALYGRTKDPALLNSAIGVGTWLVEVMCAGKKHGVWQEDHGAPMHFVTADGDLSNKIYGGVDYLWLCALHRLGKLTGDASYCRQADKAFAFLRQSQHAAGAYLDHYDPGWPPKPYDSQRWKTYAGKQVISDNVLRSALGAARLGDAAGARKALAWLKVKDGIPAYLDLASGGSGFEPGAKVYFDVTSSGLHRSLCQYLGDKQAAARDQAFLQKTVDKSGSWYWGVFEQGLAPVRPELSPMPGLWATEDLSGYVT